MTVYLIISHYNMRTELLMVLTPLKVLFVPLFNFFHNNCMVHFGGVVSAFESVISQLKRDFTIEPT